MQIVITDVARLDDLMLADRIHGQVLGHGIEQRGQISLLPQSAAVAPQPEKHLLHDILRQRFAAHVFEHEEIDPPVVSVVTQGEHQSVSVLHAGKKSLRFEQHRFGSGW